MEGEIWHWWKRIIESCEGLTVNEESVDNTKTNSDDYFHNDNVSISDDESFPDWYLADEMLYFLDS